MFCLWLAWSWQEATTAKAMHFCKPKRVQFRHFCNCHQPRPGMSFLPQSLRCLRVCIHTCENPCHKLHILAQRSSCTPKCFENVGFLQLLKLFSNLPEISQLFTYLLFPSQQKVPSCKMPNASLRASQPGENAPALQCHLGQLPLDGALRQQVIYSGGGGRRWLAVDAALASGGGGGRLQRWHWRREPRSQLEWGAQVPAPQMPFSAFGESAG